MGNLGSRTRFFTNKSKKISQSVLCFESKLMLKYREDGAAYVNGNVSGEL